MLERFTSSIGIFILLALSWSLSSNHKIINWRLIVWGLVLQILFALFIFQVPAGVKFFIVINDIVIKILDSASAGARFVFGRLALPPGTANEAGETSLGFILAFQAFPAIIFFSSLMSVLYFLRIMPLIIRAFSYIFTKLMNVSGAESVYTATNIFAGVESVFSIRPYLLKMTRSELFTLTTVGMAGVSSNVMALYVYSLKDLFPTIAGHLVSASILSAPAALMISKLMEPETGKPETLGIHIKPDYEKDNNLVEAIMNGANGGLKLIAGIVAMLIAFIGLVALLDIFLGWIGSIAGIRELSLKYLLGYIFYPFTFILGISADDSKNAAIIIGERIVLTEVTSYQDLAVAIKTGIITNHRTIVIITYALCGFAHFASMAIFIGGIAALVPDKKSLLAKISFKSLIAATIACLITACIAGIFAQNNHILMVK